MREYYDRGLDSETNKLHPASPSQQQMFDNARTHFTQAIAIRLPEICAVFPDVQLGLLEMQCVLDSFRTREFKIFRQEDASMTIDAESNAAFVR